MDYAGTGQMIAQARKKKEWTQKQLAQQLHISDRTVSKWECGKGFPDPSLLEPLSNALDIPMSDLIRGQYTEVEPDEDIRLREAIQFVHETTRKIMRKRIVGVVQAAFAIFVLIMVLENVLFCWLTGGDGMRRWERVDYFRNHYAVLLDGFKEDAVYRIEWLSGQWRTVITDASAIDELLDYVEDIELKKEYKKWSASSVEGYLILTRKDNILGSAPYVLSFPAFTITHEIGKPNGTQYYYECSMYAREKIEAIVEELVEEGKADRKKVGT